VDIKLEYDPKDANSIKDYALRLENKTFLEVIKMRKDFSNERVLEYSNSFRKGRFGNLLEEVYFGFKPNSSQEPDFPEAGVELKTSPYEINKNGKLRAGERLVITMIEHNKPIESDFFSSHVWKKMRLMLLIYYYRNKAINDKLLYKISFVRMFTPPQTDLLIIKQDYDYIVSKIQAGKAHELSESDTMYLGASTKGANAEKSTYPQYYGDRIPARSRAFGFKTSYMTYVLNHYISGSNDENSILKDVGLLKKKTFEDIIEEIVEQFVGKSDRELCQLFGREYNNNKAQWNDLAFRILGTRNEHADEFDKANIVVKTIRVEENDRIVENMLFPPFKFLELANEEFDDSTLKDYFDETRLFFFVWKRDGDVYKVAGCQLWHMPFDDLNITVRSEWEEYKRIINYGVKFKKIIDRSGKVSFSNNLPSKSDTKIIHVRPHAQKAAYRFNNGEEYGNVSRDANMLPNGEYMTTQSFWLNNDYVLKQLECIKN